MKLTTTLNRIPAHNLSHAGWTQLLAGLGKTRADDEPLPFATIVRSAVHHNLRNWAHSRRSIT